MTDDEARRLATRFIDTWPTGTRAYIWRDMFIDLEPAGLARDAYHRLERECDRAPTPGRIPRRLPGGPRRAQTVLRSPATCHECDGTGWVQTTDLTEKVDGQPHHYTQVIPCLCTRGQAILTVHARILDHNRRT